MILHQLTIVPINIYADTIEALFFGQYFAHPVVILKNTKTNNKLTYTITDNSLTKLNSVPYDVVCLDKIEPGEYELYTTNIENTERTYGFKVIVTGDKKLDILTRAIKLASADKNDDVQEFVSYLKETDDIIQKIFTEFSKQKDESLQLVYANILKTLIDIRNTRIKSYRLTAKEFVVDPEDKTFEIDSSSNKVLRYTCYAGHMEEYVKPMLTQKHSIQEREKMLYFYIEVSQKDNMPINFTYSFRPTRKIEQTWKTAAQKRNETYTRTLERTIDTSSVLDDFTDTELTYLSVITKLQSSVPIMHSPNLYYEHGQITVTPFEDDIPLLEQIFPVLYLVITEPEYSINPDDRRKIPMEASAFTVYNESVGLGAELYLYWIEDDKGTVLSDIKTFDLSSYKESVTALIFDAPKNNELNEKLRKYNVYKYAEHLKPYVLSTAKDYYAAVEDSLRVATEDPYSDSSSIAKNLLLHNCTISNIYDFAPMAFSVMQDHAIYGRYRQNFFQEPIYYKYTVNTVDLPMGDDILYKIERYSFNDGWTVEYIPSNPKTATAYRFENTDFGFMSAIKLTDMSISGFLMFDFSKKGFRAEVSRFMIKNVEVDF